MSPSETQRALSGLGHHLMCGTDGMSETWHPEVQHGDGHTDGCRAQGDVRVPRSQRLRDRFVEEVTSERVLEDELAKQAGGTGTFQEARDERRVSETEERPRGIRGDVGPPSEA